MKVTGPLNVWTVNRNSKRKRKKHVLLHNVRGNLKSLHTFMKNLLYQNLIIAPNAKNISSNIVQNVTNKFMLRRIFGENKLKMANRYINSSALIVIKMIKFYKNVATATNLNQ